VGRASAHRNPRGHAAPTGTSAQLLQSFSLHVDAWAAYDTNAAVGYIYRGKHTAADVTAARNEAISYAAGACSKNAMSIPELPPPPSRR